MRCKATSLALTSYKGYLKLGPALGDAGPNWEQFRSAQVHSQLAPRSVELGAGPSGIKWSNWLKAGPANNY